MTIPTKKAASELNAARPTSAQVARFEAKKEVVTTAYVPSPAMIAHLAAKAGVLQPLAANLKPAPTAKVKKAKSVAPVVAAVAPVVASKPKIRAKAAAVAPVVIPAPEVKIKTKRTAPKVAAVAAAAGKITLVDYSERAIAVIGDTKPIKEALKAIGGRWNSHLKCGAGWIFSKSKLPQLQAFAS
jgi:hypothetical protein